MPGYGNNIRELKHPVSTACLRCGVRQRKNIKRIYGWGARKQIVVDLAPSESRILHDNSEKALARYLDGKGCYAFPALDIPQVRPIVRDTELAGDGAVKAVIVCPAKVKELRLIADCVASAIRQAVGKQPAILNDHISPETLRASHVIILGGSHQNRLAYYLSSRSLAYADWSFPGRSGCLIHHLCGICNPAKNIIQLAVGKKGAQELMLALKNRMRLDARGHLVFKYGDLVRLSPELQGMFCDPHPLLNSIVKYAQQRYNKNDCRGFQDAARRLAGGYDCGGLAKNLYTGFNVPAVIKTFHAYKITGDKRFLRVFKRALWGLVEYYLDDPKGASYVSDYDFYLGGLITVWNLAEQEPIFSKSERLVVTNLLLASVRQIYRYKEFMWPTAPGHIRFNHETFPALSVYQASLYFKKYYAIKDFTEWDKMAAQCFSGPIARHEFHKENAATYRWFVPAHKLFFDVLSGGLETIHNGICRKTARNAVTTVDNFGHMVDYGDTDYPIGGAPFLAPYIQAAACAVRDPVLARVALKMEQSVPADPFVFLPQPSFGHTGDKSVAPGAFPRAGCWERVALPDHVRKKFRPQMPAKYLADKIGFRTGWNNSDQFLLMEPQSCGSHNHCDMNAILRYNHLGRIWLVDNGYGMPSDETNAVKAWRRRETGPNDHNTVIFRGRSGTPIYPPPFCAVLYLGVPLKNLFVLQSALCGIEGARWLRSVIVGHSAFLLVIDQIMPGDNLAGVECQWNSLGKLSCSGNTRILEQKGIKLFHQHFGGMQQVEDVYSNLSWQNCLTPRLYRFARNPVRKFSQIVDAPCAGTSIRFVNFFCATRNALPACHVAADETNIRVSGVFPRDGIGRAGGLTLNLEKDGLVISAPARWKLPADLTDKMFGATGQCAWGKGE